MKSTHRNEDDDDDENTMKQVRCSNGCSLDINSAVLTGSAAAEDRPVLSSNTRLLDLSCSSTSIWLYSLVSGGDGVWIQGERVNNIHTTLVSAPQTQVCVREGSGHHVCIPAWGRDPLPACRVLRPGPLRSVEPDE